MPRTLRPLRFHEQLRATLRELEPGLWRWFSSDKFGKSYSDDVRLELLRSTYRMPQEDHAKLYAIATEVARALAIEAPITLYQAQEDGALNAGLLFVPGAVHVVLRGPVTQTLSDGELHALFGHELAHYDLWTRDGGEHRVTGALVEHVAASPGAAPSHVQTALRMRKWTEIYADRGALVACDDLGTAVACLVKMSTGLSSVSAEAYVAQAREAIDGPTKSDALTHPETFVRAFALESWARGEEEDEKLRQLVEGLRQIDALDLIQQREMSGTTQRLIARVLTPSFMRTETTLAHARRFFPDATFDAPDDDELLFEAEGSVAEYAAYVLLDFGMVDGDIEELSMPWIAHLAGELGVRETFHRIARKELRLSAASYAELERRGADLAKPAQPAIAQASDPPPQPEAS